MTVRFRQLQAPGRYSIVDSYPNDGLESPSTVGHCQRFCRLRRFTSSSSRVPEDAETIIVELSRYSLDLVREDAEFILYRAHSKQLEPPSILLLTPSSTRPSQAATPPAAVAVGKLN